MGIETKLEAEFEGGKITFQRSGVGIKEYWSLPDDLKKQKSEDSERYAFGGFLRS